MCPNARTLLADVLVQLQRSWSTAVIPHQQPDIAGLNTVENESVLYM
jgi:hypothetical protein